jgi:hypothetical protein
MISTTLLWVSHSAPAILRYVARYPGGSRSKLAHGNGADMGASAPVWSIAIAVIAALVVSDHVFSARRIHPSTLREAPAGRQFIWQLRLHSMLGLGLRRDIHERRIFRLLCQQRSPFNRQFVRLFVYRVAVSRIAQRKVLLLGIVLALAARTGFIDGRRVMTPMLLAMIAIGGSSYSDKRTRRTTQPARLDAEATTDGLG